MKINFIINIHMTTFCDHPRKKRVDKNFVRCLACGDSFVDLLTDPKNKKSDEFIRENSSFGKNFERNFNNVISVDDPYSSKPLYEYYMDRNGTNHVIVNKQRLFNSDPPVYQIYVNNVGSKLNTVEISKILRNLKTLRVSKEMFINNKKN